MLPCALGIQAGTSQHPMRQIVPTIPATPRGSGNLSNSTCCHSIRVWTSQFGCTRGGEAGRSYLRPTGGTFVVERDRRRRELRTGAFSLLLGVVALHPRCEEGVWHVHARVCAWGLKYSWIRARSLRGGSRSHGRDREHPPGHLRGGRE